MGMMKRIYEELAEELPKECPNCGVDLRLYAFDELDRVIETIYRLAKEEDYHEANVSRDR